MKFTSYIRYAAWLSARYKIDGPIESAHPIRGGTKATPVQRSAVEVSAGNNNNDVERYVDSLIEY